MKRENLNSTVAEISNSSADKRIKLQISDEAAEAALLIKSMVQIYGNPLLAVVREFFSNAVDANADTGDFSLPVHVDVTKNVGSTSISFKDLGGGMNPDQIKKNFMSFGGSTKLDSNKQIGGFGIGSKSLYALDLNATVTTVSGDIEYTWQISEAAELINEEPALGKQGTTVCIDFPEFQASNAKDYAWTIAFYYSVYGKVPIYFDEELLDFSSSVSFAVNNLTCFQHEGLKFTFSSCTHRQEKVPIFVYTIGGIAINLGNFPGSSWELPWLFSQNRKSAYSTYNYLSGMYDSKYTEQVILSFKSIPKNIGVIDLPIGKLEFTAAREALTVCDSNLEALQEIMDDLILDLKLYFESRIFQFDEYWPYLLAHVLQLDISTPFGPLKMHTDMWAYFERRSKFKLFGEDEEELGKDDVELLTHLKLVEEGYHYYVLDEKTYCAKLKKNHPDAKKPGEAYLLRKVKAYIKKIKGDFKKVCLYSEAEKEDLGPVTNLINLFEISLDLVLADRVLPGTKKVSTRKKSVKSLHSQLSTFLYSRKHYVVYLKEAFSYLKEENQAYLQGKVKYNNSYFFKDVTKNELQANGFSEDTKCMLVPFSVMCNDHTLKNTSIDWSHVNALRKYLFDYYPDPEFAEAPIYIYQANHLASDLMDYVRDCDNILYIPSLFEDVNAFFDSQTLAQTAPEHLGDEYLISSVQISDEELKKISDMSIEELFLWSRNTCPSLVYKLLEICQLDFFKDLPITKNLQAFSEEELNRLCVFNYFKKSCSPQFKNANRTYEGVYGIFTKIFEQACPLKGISLFRDFDTLKELQKYGRIQFALGQKETALSRLT